MKKLYVIILSSFLMLGCDNEKKELKAEYDKLAQTNDSIMTMHKDLAEHHSKMLKEHDKFSEELQTMEIKDSSILEDVLRHGKMLERHDAILKSHKDIIEKRQNTDVNFDDLNNIEISAKIDEMQDWNDRMRNDHEMMKNEHNTIMEEHKSVKQKLLKDQENQMK